jgi:hypothetical protein
MENYIKAQEEIVFIKNVIIQEIETKNVDNTNGVNRMVALMEAYDNSMNEIDPSQDRSQFQVLNSEKSMFLIMCEIADAINRSYGVELRFDHMSINELKQCLLDIYSMFSQDFINFAGMVLSKLLIQEYSSGLCLKESAKLEIDSQMALFKYMEGSTQMIFGITIANLIKRILFSDHSVMFALEEVIHPKYITTINNVNLSFTKKLLTVILEIGNNNGLYHSMNMLTSKILENINGSEVHVDLLKLIENQK